MDKIESNYFFVNRSLLHSNRWLSEPFTRGQAWVDLFGLAAHKQTYFRVRGIKVVVARGQLAYSQLTLSKRWKWSRGKVRRYLDELEKGRDIVQQNDKITTVITIVQYNRWQADSTTDSTTDSTIDGQQTVHIQEGKEGKDYKDYSPNPNPDPVGDDNLTKPQVSPDEFMVFWNSHENLPRIRTFTTQRKRLLAVRSKESEFADNWQVIIDKLNCSPFHTGQGNRNWRANVDWLLKNDTNYVKILELAEPEYSSRQVSEEEAEQLMAEVKADDS